MSGRPTRDTAEGRVYLDLQNLARQAGRPSDELQQLYALEGFLDRLTRSAHADRFVLKGGVLLAAFDTRRPTRDVDLAARDLHNSAEAVRRIVVEIVKIELHDGLALDSQAITAEVIRVGDAYSGVRVSVSGTLASARLLFHVDINVGDPISPAAETVSLPRLLGGELVVTGYPLAEKIVTAVQRGTANTRWRDFTDVARLAAVHRVDEGVSPNPSVGSPNIGRRRSRPSPMCSRAMQAQRRGGGQRGDASTDSRKSP
ncbi:MAG: nucleotidyl transferase AbiEii/AbiGii toxin family protein [Euzebyaceae bacterium]|nr:nucleotidyl transferase AbiEii/AbiGii toxin family protein [Euzebyaceae bacterium]